MIYIHYPIHNHSNHEINSLIEIFKEKFDALIGYVEGNKISIYENKLYNDKAPGILQPIIRNYYNQNRYHLKKFLEINFQDYNTFLIYLFNVYQFCYQEDVKKNILDMLNYNEQLRKGLDKLYNLYNKYYDFKALIEKIIKDFCDYKIKCSNNKVKSILYFDNDNKSELSTPDTSPNLSSTPNSTSLISSITSSMSASLINFNLN